MAAEPEQKVFGEISRSKIGPEEKRVQKQFEQMRRAGNKHEEKLPRVKVLLPH